MHPLPAIFKVVFDVYNFSIISNLFNSDKPYALSTHNRKCANKMHHILRSTQIKAKQFKQVLREDYSKRTKITIIACKFSKFFRGSMPPDPFLLLNQLQICSAEKYILAKSVEIMLPLFKTSRYATEHHHWLSTLNQSEKLHGAKDNRLHSKYLTIYRE